NLRWPEVIGDGDVGVQGIAQQQVQQTLQCQLYPAHSCGRRLGSGIFTIGNPDQQVQVVAQGTLRVPLIWMLLPGRPPQRPAQFSMPLAYKLSYFFDYGFTKESHDSPFLFLHKELLSVQQ